MIKTSAGFVRFATQVPSTKILEIGSAILVLMFISTLVVCRPGWIVGVLARQSPEVVYFVETAKPVVALTIDDGPDPVTTPKILNLLKQYDAHATFFLITNRIPDNEAIVARIVAENHELGNHLTTEQPSIRLTPAEFERQLLEAHQVLSDFSDIRWFRPGSGWYNAQMLSTVHRYDYQTALGSVYPFDSHIPSAWFATRHILWNVQPGSIIILHDYGTRGERTASALVTILPELRRRGFRVVTLSELTAYGED